LEDYTELKKLHWDSKNGVFADWGNDTTDVELVEGNDEFGQQKWRRVVNGSMPSPKYVNHVGYVSFFPLALQLIPKDAPELEISLDVLESTDHLWTEYGIRSLSSKSSLYGRKNTPHDPPYWRSPIWINMNYLLLRALKAYATGNGAAATKSQKLAAQLRCNLIKNIVYQYNSKGFVFENYDDLTGEGKGCYPFTGWTALLGLISMDTGELSDLDCRI
jgi:mannosyl-oligosaccharide glucosidase